VAGIHDYWLFVLSAVLLNIAPGQDTLYILGRSLGQGRRVGIASALGVSAGTVVHTFAAALGLSAIVAASATAFLVIKLLGAAYLVYLGVRAIVAPSTVLSLDTARTGDARAAFRQGLVTNVLNPKVGLFFLAFLPQFVDPDRGSVAAQAAALGITFVAIAMVSDGTYAVVAAALADRLRRSRRAGQVKRFVTGGIFVALGLTAATAHRST
jgi:threonine/homoserine/homoserine lactone efflux protein